jgi:hypothetical protein
MRDEKQEIKIRLPQTPRVKNFFLTLGAGRALAFYENVAK